MARKKPSVEELKKAAEKGILLDWTEEPPDYSKPLDQEDEQDDKETSG